MPKDLKPPNPDSQSEKDANTRSAADEKLCRALVNSITEYAVILTNPEGLIISLNKGAEFILGYHEEEVTGKTIAIFYPPETLPSDGPELNLREALINNNYEVKGWRIKKNGDKFFARIQYKALYDNNGALLGYTKIVYELAADEAAEIAAGPTKASE